MRNLQKKLQCKNLLISVRPLESPVKSKWLANLQSDPRLQEASEDKAMGEAEEGASGGHNEEEDHGEEEELEMVEEDKEVPEEEVDMEEEPTQETMVEVTMSLLDLYVIGVEDKDT